MDGHIHHPAEARFNYNGSTAWIRIDETIHCHHCETDRIDPALTIFVTEDSAAFLTHLKSAILRAEAHFGFNKKEQLRE